MGLIDSLLLIACAIIGNRSDGGDVLFPLNRLRLSLRSSTDELQFVRTIPRKRKYLHLLKVNIRN
ncbi:MAG TPA: hypothetical protein VKY37_05630 [Brumimicrobium sp.]|nr:hypothetical protein [Brumimicrobium sp.]